MERVVIGMTESDCHTVSLHMFRYFLEEHGIEVVNLGACVPLETMLETARRVQADALVLGAQNGHARDDLRRLGELKRRYPECPPIFVGGRLGLSEDTAEEDGRAVRALGVDHLLGSFDQFLAFARRREPACA